MKDSYNRNIHYLRISITDRCNLRCRYCMPENGVDCVPHDGVLQFEEIIRLVQIMASLGVNRVRLTGGEPLVRKDIAALAQRIKQIEGISFVGLTTNGVLLPAIAKDLLNAGVDGINVSLDTLNLQRYEEITLRNHLPEALNGLEAALALGFPTVKVNCVLAPTSQPEDWLSVVALAQKLPIDVRLIEWMPMAGEDTVQAINSDDALALIQQTYGALTPVASAKGSGPARHWQIEGFKGRLGIIHAMSHNFCDSCNRLRLTATGDLKLCLFYDSGIALKPLLRSDASDSEISAAILQAVAHKPKQHLGKLLSYEKDSAYSQITHANGMYKTGG